METRMWIAVFAIIAAFTCAYFASIAIRESLRRRSSSSAGNGSNQGARSFIAWRLRNGYKPLAKLAMLALKSSRICKVADEFVIVCKHHGYTSTRRPAATVLIAVIVASSCFVGFLSQSIIAALAAFACACAILIVMAGSAADKRTERIRDAVPAAIESMSACFGSGFTLLQTFRQVACDAPGPLGDTFARCAHALEMGGSASQALAELRQGTCASELAFVSVALDVQHQSGGGMQHVLDAAADTVKGELALRRSLRVQTAQAKLSARVVVIMPFVLIAAFSLASPDFLMPFFSSPMGYALLALAIIMQIGGILLVRKALAVEGVS